MASKNISKFTSLWGGDTMEGSRPAKGISDEEWCWLEKCKKSRSDDIQGYMVVRQE
jgi:hypothetical protein